jgi:hypothetical protein
MGKVLDLAGRTFDRLTVLERYPISYEAPCGTKTPLWVCRCDCGCETVVQSRNLTTGRTRSCGCLRVENARLQGERRRHA